VTVDASDEFSVVGWAVDEPNGRGAGDVDVVLDATALPASYGIDRPDVATYLRGPAYGASGFSARLSGADVGRGVRTLTIRILSADRSCYYRGPTVWVVAR
jgi:hypothetical protein